VKENEKEKKKLADVRKESTLKIKKKE